MADVLEINRFEELAVFHQDWERLLAQTAGASFFQSFDWLECYWRHFGTDQKLRVLVVMADSRPTGILPLVVRTERTRVGRLRLLGFPLDNWGSFYGPLGPTPYDTLWAGLDHIRRTPCDWDVLELRWLGAPETDPAECRRAMLDAGFQAYATHWNHTAVVDTTGSWESYWSARKGAWLRRFRHAEQELAKQGEITYIRYRSPGDCPNFYVSKNGTVPLSLPGEDAVAKQPRWDLYDVCEEIARHSWQAAATDGTTLSDDSVRTFLRETHAAACAAGAVDLNLLLVGGRPAAFIYGYQTRGYVYGLRRGYDPTICRAGAGNVLLARTLQDSFARGDRLYDMGIGSLESKRHFQTRLMPIWRLSHYRPMVARAQLLRLKRWWRQTALPASIAAGRVQEGTADAR